MVNELSILESIKVSKCPFRVYEKVKNIQIHGFCGSSLDAYAAVFYVRVVFLSNDVQVTYLWQKQELLL